MTYQVGDLISLTVLRNCDAVKSGHIKPGVYPAVILHPTKDANVWLIAVEGNPTQFTASTRLISKREEYYANDETPNKVVSWHACPWKPKEII